LSLPLEPIGYDNTTHGRTIQARFRSELGKEQIRVLLTALNLFEVGFLWQNYIKSGEFFMAENRRAEAVRLYTVSIKNLYSITMCVPSTRNDINAARISCEMAARELWLDRSSLLAPR
jgi:hypothetical protein